MVPAANPEIVVVAVFPVIFPGLIVQSPAGRSFNTTLPVTKRQVGWVMVPTVGAVGIILTVKATSEVVAAHDPFAATV
ncbi:hypothetical protein FLPS109957_11430 [Flavobacterium psychrophilum]